MTVNDLLQRVILDALESEEYTEDDIRSNVETALERHQQHLDDEDED